MRRTKALLPISGTLLALLGALLGGPATAAAHPPRPDGARSVEVGRYHDASGRITLAIFQSVAAPARSIWTDHSVRVEDPSMIAIGGGATGAEYPYGAYLTASYPSPDFSSWIVSSKDHVNARQAHELTGYAIGMKIDGVSKDQVRSWVASCSDRRASPNPESAPQVTVRLPSDQCTLLGGGFQVHWTGQGNIATASYPDGAVNYGEPGKTWTVRSKDHQVADPARISGYVVGIPTSLPVGTVLARATAGTTGGVQHPSATSAPPNSAWALSGAGARVHYSGAGSLLWNVHPYVDRGLQLVTASSKDHMVADVASITSWAISIRLA
ncbi:hypothetical protein [Streptomyces roseifaciens]|uniref:hypothetical protein n=1 Tax=Streptomyces roseifaciens TaxID=1488406 RepID=UPI0007180B45|nr:hypothetical protein [Streptomyces roseifaciens]